MKSALRMLLRSRGLLLAAVPTLALGIGANSAIFSMVNAVLLKPLPYPDAGRLVQLEGTAPWGINKYTSVPKFIAYRALSTVFDEVAASDWNAGGISLTEGDHPEQVRGAHVSAGYFRLFGASFGAGRAFTADEDRPGGGRVAVLSFGLWQRRYGSDPGVAGRTILLGGDPYTVVGIAARDFAPEPAVDLWLPLQADAASTDPAQFLFCAARLRTGVSIGQARTALQVAAGDFRRRFPDVMTARHGFWAEPLQASMTGKVRPLLLVLLAAVGCVLLIACANVANLLLAQASGRAREFAIRAAIGASRVQIMRQLLAESLALWLAGGTMGLLLGALGVRTLPDARVLAFTLGLSLITGVVFGLAPAWSASSAALNFRGQKRTRARSLLVISEMAIAIVLLAAAGLWMRSFVALQRVQPGFDPHHLFAMQTAIDGSRFDRAAAVVSAVRAADERLPAESAATSALPLEASTGTAFRIEGRPLTDGPYHGGAWWRYVTPRFFDVCRIPILRGRGFTARDDGAAPPVIIINQTMARQYWPDRSPIGERIRLFNGDAATDDPPREIAGVAADVRENGLDEEPGNSVYVPLAQLTDRDMGMARRIGPLFWMVRAERMPAPDSVAGLPATRVRPMEEALKASEARERFNTLLLGAFAATAIVLASIGLYGVMAWSIEQRTAEFGIRMALGADSARLRRSIVRQAMTLTGAGIALGLAAALAGTRLLASLLFRVEPRDPVVFVTAPLVMVGVALVASALPARRVLRIDPAAALRSE